MSNPDDGVLDENATNPAGAHLTMAAAAQAGMSGEERREFSKFVTFLFDRAQFDGLDHYSPEELQAIALSIWRFAAYRKAMTRLVRVYNPALDEDGWASRHTVVDIVCDDMPFLIDSVLGELNEWGLRIHGIMHPIVEVRRDGEGARLGVEAAAFTEAGAERLKSARDNGYLRESIMHVELERQNDPEVLSSIQQRILFVLSNVAQAVSDWKPMRHRLNESIEGLRSADLPGVPAEEISESIDFLNWLLDNNFAFLGMRDYRVVGGVEAGDLQIVEDSGLGLLRDPNLHVLRRRGELVAMTPEVRNFLLSPRPIIVTKANVRSTVHRRAYMDYLGIKFYGENGEVTGERRIVGLFTAAAYNRSPWAIPLLRRKARIVVERAHLPPGAHDERALMNIIETFPRDEFLHVPEEELLPVMLGVLRLQKRPRTKIFVRYDQFDRFVSVLVFVPRDRYNSAVREKMGAILSEVFDGHVSAYYPHFGDGPLARVHFIIGRKLTALPHADLGEIEHRLEHTVRDWNDDLRNELDIRVGGVRSRELFDRYGQGFSASYQEEFWPVTACTDIEVFETLSETPAIAFRAYREPGEVLHSVRVKLYHWDRPIPLSDCMPVFEQMGLRVLDEAPHHVELGRDSGMTAAGLDGSRRSIWIHDFRMEKLGGPPVDLDAGAENFADAFQAIWFGEAENDGFNRLVLEERLTWRDIVILRALAKYYRQAGMLLSQQQVETVFCSHGGIARQLIDLFKVRFDPDFPDTEEERMAQVEGARASIRDALDQVESLEADRIVRNFSTLIMAAQRTNYFQRDEAGASKPSLAIKFASRKIDFLPPPKPFAEIFVYSPRVEGVHLRQGMVARGGLRWSDRREDFRTEILGLVKAQQVKNAVIVPVGAKGGFVPKNLPPNGTREEIQDEAIACYRQFIASLLDVTDNLVDGRAVHPPRVVAHDGEDPYLVVAADKGTASFSDIANDVARSYGFWLGDAFASGGSQGYDHKGMAITARGAWEAVKRHFRELGGHDIQSTPFTVAGVGDMSGDVFGNGMLLSRQIRLVAAFDHRDIFLDPDPDPERSFQERQRLFKFPRSSWADYDPGAISPGGGVFSRKRKSIYLTEQVRKALDIDQETATPGELIRAILSAPVDLMWFGGIGTYVKASSETNYDVGDTANDGVRIDATQLRARVVGEGANLGVTQLGRIEFARGGGKINSDAVDNSAGVDCSDHEVNIKIALDSAVHAGQIGEAARNDLLRQMTDEVADLVLRNNYRQTLAVSVAESAAYADVDSHGRFMRMLERRQLLDRKVELLPDDETLQELKESGRGLTRAEISVLIAYSKITLFDDLIASPVPDDPYLDVELTRYFPELLSERFASALAGHRLRREIIATMLGNDLVNTAGLTYVSRIQENLGIAVPLIARAFVIVRDIFDVRELRAAINDLDFVIPAAVQTELHRELLEFIRSQSLWFLRNCPQDAPIGEVIESYRPGTRVLETRMESLIGGFEKERFAASVTRWTDAGVPADLARKLTVLDPLSASCDITDVTRRWHWAPEETARAYFAIGAILGLDRLRAAAMGLSSTEHWERLAIRRSVEDLNRQQRRLTSAAIGHAMAMGGDAKDRQDGQAAVDTWTIRFAESVQRATAVIAEMEAAGPLTGAKLSLAANQIRDLAIGLAGEADRQAAGESSATL